MGQIKSIHMYNSTSDKVYVECDESAEKGFLKLGESLRFGVGPDGYKHVTVKVFDGLDQVVKSVDFSSWCDDSWIIKPEGVKKQKYGANLSKEDVKGKLYPWTVDITKEHEKGEEIIVQKN